MQRETEGWLAFDPKARGGCTVRSARVCGGFVGLQGKKKKKKEGELAFSQNWGGGSLDDVLDVCVGHQLAALLLMTREVATPLSSTF
ncbi:hypothetical protein Cni_G11489 [Canna indica]|uniref:Uncharacterized protein n=1 Tax=Canna indica TaxID=4628 RepID=A0AAQ3K6F9_9LILI|nr:hypothetical protein Cni_G11489 [Canna indica]